MKVAKVNVEFEIDIDESEVSQYYYLEDEPFEDLVEQYIRSWTSLDKAYPLKVKVLSVNEE